MLNIFLNADDYAWSKFATDSINKCLDADLLHSTSIIAGGNDAERAIELLKQRPNTRITVHLNLFDGHAIANKGLVSDLINKDGKFKFNLMSLWYAINVSNKRQSIKEQIFIEFCSQIDFILLHFPEIPIRLDGHQHIHAMPALLPVMEKIFNKYKISYVRTPIEDNYLFSSSFIKYLKGLFRRSLLKRWGGGVKSLLDKLNISTADYFIGSALSCEMSFDYLSSTLDKLSDKNGIVEIMLHPWSSKEQDMILSEEFKKLVVKYNRLSI